MNLYLRLIWTLLRGWRQPRLAGGDTLERTLRVLPNDLDLNGHMNNGRYLTLIDLMLVEYFVRIGFARVLLKRGWRPMAGGSFITYRRGLAPLQAYTLRFRLELHAVRVHRRRPGVRGRLHEGCRGRQNRPGAQRPVVRRDGPARLPRRAAGTGARLAGGGNGADGRGVVAASRTKRS